MRIAFFIFRQPNFIFAHSHSHVLHKGVLFLLFLRCTDTDIETNRKD